jgi:sporulation protein YqfD
MYISVNLNQSKNFFAIAKELCYNIEKVREYGKGLPILFLLRNFGLVLGAILFTAIVFLSSNRIFGIEYSGSGKALKHSVQEYLSTRGITVYSKFSDIDLSRLEDEILANNDGLTFVSVEKKGNILSVYAILRKENVNVLKGDCARLVSTVSGVVESVKVYRGTAMVKVGDQVEKGALLVDGFVNVKEQVLTTNVIACVTLKTQRNFTYVWERSGESQTALILAREQLDGVEILSESVTEKEIIRGSDTVYEYSVTFEYRSVLYAG